MVRKPYQTSMRPLTIAAVLVAAAVARSGAQMEPLKQPTSIPMELASALVSAGGFGSGSEPQILVGSAPEWLTPRLYMPSGARIVGSAFYDRTTVVVMSVPLSHDTVLKELDREMKTKGWKDTPNFQNQYQGGGFRPSVATQPQGAWRAYQLCGPDKEYMNGWVTHTDALSQIVVIRITGFSGTGYSTCNPPTYPNRGERYTMPTLFDPTGATASPQAMMSCEPMQGGWGGTGTGTTLKTQMTPDAILDHYGKQLKDSGWTQTANVPSAISRAWTRKDSTGATIMTVLTVTTHPTDATCRQIQMQYRTPNR